MRVFWAFWVGLFIVLPTADAGRTYYRKVSLHNVLQSSDAVFVVEKAKLFVTTKDISITPKGKKPDPAKYPPFQARTFHYKVIRQLYPYPPKGRRARLIGKKIKVLPASQGLWLRMHQLYYLENTRKSPIIRDYRSATSGKAWGQKRHIIFVRKLEERWGLTLSGAYETLDRLAAIKAALHKLHAPSRAVSPEPPPSTR
ncbi:MAG: hypothetical protein H6727_16980 [Myxococcales bacterium]|nr:hypothetical protein [Myxococcales bacterium]